MISYLSVAAGAIAGAIHVFSGPDHLAALAPLAVDQRKRTWLTGFLWGIGHSSGVWLLAALALVFRESLPIEWMSAVGERLVGIVLVAIGLWGLRKVLADRVHDHPHSHGGLVHTHPHLHSGPTESDGAEGTKRKTHSHSHSALAIGTLHGVAGTSHLLGVLPALLLPTRLAAVLYVVGFGLGSIMAMTVFSWSVGLFARWMGDRGMPAHRWLAVASCAAALVVGYCWLSGTGIGGPQ